MESAKPLAASLGRYGPVGGPPGADYVVHRRARDLLFEAHAQRGQPAEGGGNRIVRLCPEAVPAQPPHGVEHIRAVVRVDLADQFVLAGPCIYDDGDRAAIRAAPNGLDARLLNCTRVPFRDAEPFERFAEFFPLQCGHEIRRDCERHRCSS